MTALHRAAQGDRVEAIQWLLEHGANATAKDKLHQGTPADWAFHCKSPGAARLLEDSGRRSS